MAKEKINGRDPITCSVYFIRPNATTNIDVGAGFRGFAIISAYSSNDLNSFFVFSTNGGGNAYRVKTGISANAISIPSAGNGTSIPVTNTCADQAILMLFKSLIT